MTRLPPALERARAFVRRSLVEPEAPLLAVEVRPAGLGVVRLERQGGRVGLAAAASADLAPGLLELSSTEKGIKDEEGLGRALGGLLERAGALREGTAALVLPDVVGRISVVKAQELQGKRGRDLEELARFRLRRTVPFDVRDAQVAVELPPRGGPETAVVAAVYRPVILAFEGLLTRLGLRAGLVELSSLALLEALDPSDGDRLLVNWDEGYASLVLARDGWPLLVRTLPEAAAAPESLRREVANTLLYYKERLGGSGLAGACVRSARIPVAEAATLLEEPLGMRPAVLDPWAAFGGGDPEAGQLLASALCAAGRGAARRAA